MKSYLVIVTMLVGVTALWLVKILYEGVEPPARLVQDMVQKPERPHREPPPGAVPFGHTSKEPELSGQELFLRHCATCHGENGMGKSFVAQQPGMPDVSDLTSSTATEDEQLRILTQGRGAMPAFGTRLSAPQRHLLIRYIRTLP